MFKQFESSMIETIYLQEIKNLFLVPNYTFRSIIENKIHKLANIFKWSYSSIHFCENGIKALFVCDIKTKSKERFDNYSCMKLSCSTMWSIWDVKHLNIPICQRLLKVYTDLQIESLKLILMLVWWILYKNNF